MCVSILCCWEGVLYVFCESVFKVSFSFVCLFVCLCSVFFCRVYVCLMYCSIFFLRLFFCFLLYFFLLCLLLACLCVWVVFFCFLQFSLPITKYFVLLITGFFSACLRSHSSLNKVFFYFFILWVFIFLWMVSFSMTTVDAVAFTACLCGCYFLLILS